MKKLIIIIIVMLTVMTIAELNGYPVENVINQISNEFMNRFGITNMMKQIENLPLQ